MYWLTSIFGAAVPTLIFVGIIGVAVMSSRARMARVRANWTEAARRLGMQIDTRSGLRPKIFGQRDGMAVSVDVYTTGSGKNQSTWTRYQISTTGPAQALNLGPEHFFSSLGVSLTNRVDHVIGDPAFDDAAIIDGNEAAALAVLRHGFRHPFSVAMREGWRLKAGTFYLRRSGVEDDAHRIVFQVERALALARSATVSNVPAQIARNALIDPEHGVRQRSFAFALARYPDHDATRAMLKDGRTSVWADVRIRVASRLGREGIPDLESVVVDGRVPPPWRADALRRLERLDAPCAADLALNAVRAGYGALLDAGLDVAQRQRLLAFAPHIRARLARHEAHDVPKAIRALAATGDTSDESLLLGNLDADHEAIVVASLEALGALGTIAVVPRLLDLSKGVFRDRDVKRAARAAVEAIQSRATGGGHGGLAVAVDVPAGGEVAVVADVPAQDEDVGVETTSAALTSSR